MNVKISSISPRSANTRPVRFVSLAACVAAAMWLSACGGGGDAQLDVTPQAQDHAAPGIEPPLRRAEPVMDDGDRFGLRLEQH